MRLMKSVTVPPPDQRHVDRLGLLYFSRPHNDVVLATVNESPVLQREGYTENEFEKSGNKVPTMEGMFFLGCYNHQSSNLTHRVDVRETVVAEAEGLSWA